MSNKSTSDLNLSLSNNLALHAIIENEVKLTPFGQITFNVFLVNGEVQLDRVNIVKNRRFKYRVDNSQ